MKLRGGLLRTGGPTGGTGGLVGRDCGGCDDEVGEEAEES